MLSESLKSKILEFRRQRDWEKFHDARSLTAAIAIEAAELQEIFLWAKDGEVAGRVTEQREHIEQEVADVAIYLACLCHDLGIDLEASVEKKLAINEAKYPVEKSRGSSKKYDQLG